MNADLLQAIRDFVDQCHGDDIRREWGFQSGAELSSSELDAFIDEQSNTWLLSAIEHVGNL